MTTEMTASHGTVKGSEEALALNVKNVKNVVGDPDEPLSEVARSTSDRLATARTRIEARLCEARSGLHDARLAVTQKAKYAAGATDGYVRDNPWQFLAVAAAAGVVLGFVLRRR